MATITLPSNIGHGPNLQSIALGARILLALRPPQMAAALGLTTRAYNRVERDGYVPEGGSVWFTDRLREMIAEELTYPRPPGYRSLAERFPLR